MAKRFDIGTLASPRIMPDGKLIVDAKLTRTGVFKYANPDGSERLEYRPPNAVFDETSLATFPLTSVTNDHPDTMVSTETASAVTVGVIAGDVRKVDSHVAARLVIFDAKAISDIQGGKLELSCGYTADVEVVEGISPDGERYDSVQSNICINHVAIVDVGRAGPEAKIHMDSARQIPFIKDEKANNMDPEIIKKMTDLELKILTESARADKAEAQVLDETKRADKAEAERDDAKERADKAEAERKDAADGLGDKIKARIELCTKAAKVLDAADLSNKTDREVKVAVIAKITGAEIADAKSDDYVDARFDAAVEQSNVSDKNHQVTITTDIEDGAESPADKAQLAMLKRQAEMGIK